MLVVDAELERRRDLELALVERRVAVVGCVSTGEALTILQSKTIDAVALYAGELVQDGIETCRHIAATWPELPVVVIAEGGPVGSAAESFQAGAYDLLVNPKSLVPVVEALEHAARVGLFRKDESVLPPPAPAPIRRAM